jgi:hypothetical protein
MGQYTGSHKDVIAVPNPSTIDLADIFQASPRIMHPAMMDAFASGDLSSIIENPAEGIHVFPLFNEEYCKKLIEVAEATGQFYREEGNTYAVPELRFTVISRLLMQAYVDVATRFILPVIEEVWRLGDHFDVFRVPFICRYSTDTVTQMDRHFDAHGVLSLAVPLNAEYGGGSVFFNKQGYNNKDTPPGYATMFPSLLTHEHEVLPVTSGIRYSMTAWINSTKADQGADESWAIHTKNTR